MKPRVYVLNFGGHNLKAAYDEFGSDVVYLTEGSINVFSIDRLTYELKRKLQDFRPEDYILVSGSPVIAMVATAVLKEKGIRKINVLIYHASAKRYLPRELDGVGYERAGSDDGGAAVV